MKKKKVRFADLDGFFLVRITESYEQLDTTTYNVLNGTGKNKAVLNEKTFYTGKTLCRAYRYVSEPINSDAAEKAVFGAFQDIESASTSSIGNCIEAQ